MCTSTNKLIGGKTKSAVVRALGLNHPIAQEGTQRNFSRKIFLLKFRRF